MGGEALTWDLADQIAEAGGPRLVNHYGPTETTVGVCTFDVAGGRAGVAEWQPATVPIGRPIAGARTVVVDRHGRPLPFGVPGELWIGGAGVPAGYIGGPTRPPRASGRARRADGGRAYRTGDLGARAAPTAPSSSSGASTTR